MRSESSDEVVLFKGLMRDGPTSPASPVAVKEEEAPSPAQALPTREEEVTTQEITEDARGLALWPLRRPDMPAGISAHDRTKRNRGRPQPRITLASTS